MCNIQIRNVVGIDTNGDNQRDELIIVGVVEDCSGLQVALFFGPPSDGQQESPFSSATILGPGISSHNVTPTGNERVFEASFTLFDTTIFKGQCGTPVGADPGLGVEAVCDNDDTCRDSITWDQPIDCEVVEDECPEITLTPSDLGECVDQTRSMGLSVAVVPFTAGVEVEVDFGDGETSGPVQVTAITGTNVGIATIPPHNYSAAGSGATTFTVVARLSGRGRCQATIDIVVEPCPPEETECAITSVDLVVRDSTGANRTDDAQSGCLEAGRYVVEANTVPAGAATGFSWDVDGQGAVVGQRDVVAISGDEITIELSDSSREISVIVNGCRSNGITLDPCPGDDGNGDDDDDDDDDDTDEECCPDLQGLTASCMPRCPPSTTVTLTATGVDLQCAEAFDWEFGDGATAETNTPTTTHTYAQAGTFEAGVTIVRPDICRGNRTQRRTAIVGICAPSCFCAFLAIATAFLLLAFLTLMPLIACTSDPATAQILIITLIIVVILLVVAWLWWLLDPCCRPTQCQLLRILYWVFSWALVIVGVIFIFCVVALPFGLFYVIIQQVVHNRINANNCDPGAPDIFSWPFEGCQ